MINQEQKEKLDKIKPQNYVVKVQAALQEAGYSFSDSMVIKVYNSKRTQLIIEDTILKVFTEEERKRKVLERKKNKKLGIAS